MVRYGVATYNQYSYAHSTLFTLCNVFRRAYHDGQYNIRSRTLMHFLRALSFLQASQESATEFYIMVPTVGLEPTRPFGPQILSLRSLPIPSRRHIKKRVATNPHLPAAAHSPSSWWPPHRVRSSSLHILYFSDSSYGGQGGTRTRTPAKAPDFESGTSTNSITRPYSGFLQAPRNLYKTHFKGVHTLISSITGQLAFPAGSLSSYHPCIFSAPLKAVCPSWRTPASVFLAHTQPARFSFRTLVIVQVQG